MNSLSSQDLELMDRLIDVDRQPYSDASKVMSRGILSDKLIDVGDYALALVLRRFDDLVLASMKRNLKVEVTRIVVPVKYVGAPSDSPVTNKMIGSKITVSWGDLLIREFEVML